MKAGSIVIAMVVSIAALGVLASWDDRREATAALADFAQEQATLAREVAAAAAEPGSAPFVHAMFSEAAAQPGERIVVAHLPGTNGLTTASGRVVRLPRLEEALDESLCAASSPPNDDCSIALSHEESASLGLPPRTAMAGLATAVTRGGEPLEVAVVTSALRERDRERRSATRLLLAFVVSSGLVLALGTLALSTQQKELALAHRIAVADAVKAQDDRLVRADKLATLGALATGIAHEVSTPLGVIVGRGEQLVPKVSGDARAEKAVSAILEQATRIGEIVRGFLALARGAAPSLARASADEVAAAAKDLVQHRYDAADVALYGPAAASPDSPPRLVACDRRLLEQAVVNLLLNACEACAAGGQVELSVVADDGRVSFLVEDDGAGIAPEAVARATEPFFTTKREGTGLGLAITREIVQHHRGTLEIGPRAGGHGTVARITLPEAREEAA